MSYLIFDTNFFNLLHKIDSECSLVDLLCDVYQKTGIADHPQLNTIDYCPPLSGKLQHHNITDEEVVLFLMTYNGKINLKKIFDLDKQPGDKKRGDEVDIKFIIFTQKNNTSIFLTCEKNLLKLCRELKLEHWCFKASIHHLDKQIGGFFEEDEFDTQQMFEDSPNPKNPFFHYPINSRCLECHDNCPTHKLPPVLKK